MKDTSQPIGTIIQGSTLEGCIGRIARERSVEDMRVGQFVTVQGERARYFSMITDVRLANTTPDVLLDPPTSKLLKSATKGITTFGEIELKPMLMTTDEDSVPHSVKTIPTHFSPINEATEEDFRTVFGTEDATHFYVGQPLETEVNICLDLSKFIERSNGIFGKSGTGKSFLTRMILAGIIQKGIAANLIFDMHSEYGWESPSENGTMVKGLRQLCGSTILTYSIDPKTSRERGIAVDHEVTIGLNEIDIADLELVSGILDLSTAMIDTAYLLKKKYHADWIRSLLDMEPVRIPDVAGELGAHEESLKALKRKLEKLREFAFIEPEGKPTLISDLVANLQHKKSVIFDFGRYGNLLVYMLLVNILTRKIHASYVDQTDRWRRSNNPADKPVPLMITIEEAHKFLSPEAARHNIFGEIARELRKYFVTLLVVDQRPSGIDTEVMSQIGTRITALLSDPHDIDAVFNGVSGSSKLKQILSTLESKQQAMLLGHAVPMPIVIRTRDYGPEFYRSMGMAGIAKGTATVAITTEQSVKDIFG